MLGRERVFLGRWRGCKQQNMWSSKRLSLSLLSLLHSHVFPPERCYHATLYVDWLQAEGAELQSFDPATGTLLVSDKDPLSLCLNHFLFSLLGHKYCSKNNLKVINFLLEAYSRSVSSLEKVKLDSLKFPGGRTWCGELVLVSQKHLRNPKKLNKTLKCSLKSLKRADSKVKIDTSISPWFFLSILFGQRKVLIIL